MQFFVAAHPMDVANGAGKLQLLFVGQVQTGKGQGAALYQQRLNVLRVFTTEGVVAVDQGLTADQGFGVAGLPISSPFLSSL